jgi:hypothetical protein
VHQRADVGDKVDAELTVEALAAVADSLFGVLENAAETTLASNS